MSIAKGSEPVSAFQALGWQYMKATLLALFGLALVMAFVPRQVFQSELLVSVSQLITAHWPKLAADRVSLQRINPGFAEKFVISYAVLAGVAPLTALLMSLHVLVKTIRHGAEFKGPPIDTKILLSGVVIISFCGWWCLFFPTPFMDSAGFSTKYPRWEMALIYSALFFSFIWMGVAGFAAVAISHVLFRTGRHRKIGNSEWIYARAKK